MKMNVTRINLGVLTVKDGKVIATDPCYQVKQSWCNHIIDIKKGDYVGKATYGVVPFGCGERVTELTINHETTLKKRATKLIGRCAVDSGQCGFFLVDDYTKYHPEKDTEESEKWYKTACDITCDDDAHCVGVMQSEGNPVGFVGESGIGDGVYNLYAGFNSRGEITALRLRYI